MTIENFDSSTERTIIGFALHPNENKPQLGYVQPIGELVNNKLCALNEANFCNTMRVFVTSHYEDIERLYPDKKLFQLKIRRSVINSESVQMPCKYVATAIDASEIKPKDYFEILSCDLPSPHQRIITLESLPSTRYVFVDDNSAVHGPFKWSKYLADSPTTIVLDFLDTPLPNVSLAQYQTYKIERNKVTDVSVFDSTTHRSFVQGLSFIHGAGFYDYASDDEVVRYCAKLSGENGVRTIERSQLEKFAQTLQRIPKVNNELNRSRLSRLVNVGGDSFKHRDEISEQLSRFLKDQGKSLIQDFISTNEPLYLDKIRKEYADTHAKEMSEKQGEESKIKARIQELNDKKNELNEEIQRLTEKTQDAATLQSVYAENDKRIAQQQARLAEIDTEISQKEETIGIYKTLKELNAQIEYSKRRIDEEKKEQSKISDTTSELKSELAKADGELQKKLTQLKPYVEAINGSFTSPELASRTIAVATNDLRKQNKTNLSRQTEVVQAVRATLSHKGRHLDEWQVSNLLISTQQSFLTIFAGLPGVGKTSLARLLAETQNIKPRLQEVAVSRGWTSQKDLIGFYNPLTSRFQPANTGLYDFLNALKSETDDARAMSYVLLDEANLSPIEHYWSAFMGMTDNEGGRELTLGQQQVKIPECLRFIATINYDGTTEPLSPRLINRAPVIVLESTSIQNTPTETQDTSGISLPISAAQMSELFGTTAKVPDLEQDEKSLYESIKNILLDGDTTLGRPISISPRKEIAIRQYCAKARGLMNVDNDLLAFDIAIQQHLLPLIQGNGNRFGKRLEKLSELIKSDLPESARFLSKMITSGEADLQTYDFFCW